MKTLCVLVCVLVLMLPLAAQNPQARTIVHPQSAINITVPGLGCTAAGTNMFQAQAWSWGAAAPATTGGTGGSVGKATISDLIIDKSLDGCSPSLFGALVTGKHFATLTLVQQDMDKNVLLTITLNEVLVTSWQISGSAQSEKPSEQLGFNFLKVCVEEPSTGSKLCYDQAKNATF